MSTECAGNYLTPMVFLNSDARTPMHIRKSLTIVEAKDSPRGTPAFLTESDSLPSTWQFIRNHGGLSTNWGTFYRDLDFPSPCVTISHAPFVNTSDSRFPNMLIIFRKNAGTLSFMISTSSQELQRSIRAGEGPAKAGHIEEVFL